jgi:hypothetical protein
MLSFGMRLEEERSMKDEVELGWLKLTDNSDLVLSAGHISQQQDSGIFGESRTIIPREAITAVRLSWQRSRGALIMGVLLLLGCLIFLLRELLSVSSLISRAAQVLNLSTSTLSFIQYALLIAGIGLLLLFWFYKRYEIQITSAGASIGGNPRSYDDADKFCSLLLSGARELPPVAKAPRREEIEQPPESETDPSDWRL